jgi:aminocarboxymuconate-semialdehyde decarboxylase
MATRRNFLKGAGASGLAFCSCGLLDAARAQDRPHLPVTVNGKRIKTIDVHAHCRFHEAVALMGGEATVTPSLVKGDQEQFIVIEERLKTMDAMAIDMEVLSINPFWYRKDRDTAAKIVEIQNEKLAELCASHPDRFAAYASLALQYPDLAVQQLDTAMKKQGLRGAAIGASVLDEDFSDPKFHPVWAKAEELGAVLFIHPLGTPELSKRLKGNGWLANTVGNPLATTIALQHLIFEGTLDRFPGLKIIAAHGGGYLPSYAARDDHACFVAPPNCNPEIKLQKKPSEYLNQLYFDALVFTPEALRHLVAQVGSSQIMIGTDCPIPWEEHPVDHIFATGTLSDEDKIAILGGNAARLFGMPG